MQIKFGKTLHLKLEDKYTKIRYQEWLFAGGEDSGEKFFVDLWDPKALEVIVDPSKDTHPGAQLLRDWDKAK